MAESVVPRVRFMPHVDRSGRDYYMIVADCGADKTGEVLSLAVGGGSSQAEARANAIRFADALRQAVLALKDVRQESSLRECRTCRAHLLPDQQLCSHCGTRN
jgi:hypothetical protein